MTHDRAELARRVPHSGSMVLLARVIEWNAQFIHCGAVSHRDPHNPLREGDVLPAWAAIEYAAQAAAVHGGLLLDGQSQTAAFAHPRTGVLASLRDVRTHCERLDTVHGELELTATLKHADPAGAVYAFEASALGATLLSGQFTLMFTPEEGARDGR